MNDAKPFTKQNIILVVLFAAFIGAIWLTTQPSNKTWQAALQKIWRCQPTPSPCPKPRGRINT